MKKLVLAAALAGAMLLSGCSGVSQESNSLAADKNSSSQTESNNSSTTLSSSSSETSSEETSTSVIDITSTELNNKQLFLEKVNDILDSYDYITKHNITENDNFYSATYIVSGGVLENKQDTCTFVMFYTDDIDLICSTIIDDMNELIRYMDLGSDFYDLYVNAPDNSHILTISNADYISLQTDPCIYWENAEMQEMYKHIEENEIFKVFQTTVVNK